MKLDPARTWSLVERRLTRERDPRRRRNLELVLAHMRAEAAADIEGVLATLAERPRYVCHGTTEAALNPEGSHEAVRDFYDATIVQTGAHRIEFDCDRVIVDDDAVFTEGLMRMAYPGRTLAALGIEVGDPDAFYVAESRMGIVWPIDREQDRLLGEETYTVGDPFEGIASRPIALSDVAEVA